MAGPPLSTRYKLLPENYDLKAGLTAKSLTPPCINTGLQAKPLSIMTRAWSRVLNQQQSVTTPQCHPTLLLPPPCGSELGFTAAAQHTVFYPGAGSVTDLQRKRQGEEGEDKVYAHLRLIE